MLLDQHRIPSKSGHRHQHVISYYTGAIKGYTFSNVPQCPPLPMAQPPPSSLLPSVCLFTHIYILDIAQTDILSYLQTTLTDKPSINWETEAWLSLGIQITPFC